VLVGGRIASLLLVLVGGRIASLARRPAARWVAMAIDEGLNERVREILAARAGITEKKMFGGMAFLCRDHLFLGAREGRLLVRVGPARYAEALKLPHVRPMAMKGRTMSGYVWVDEPGFDDDDALQRFVEWGAAVAASMPAKEKKAPRARKKKTPRR